VTTYRLDIAYDGGGFSGWAVQPGKRTVQGEIESALERLFGEPVQLTVAGRTDAGVHALGQVASFATERTPPEALGRALNALTGPEVAITGAEPVADGFDARRSALSRRYRYRIETGAPPSPFERGRALAWPHRLDREGLDACASALLGEHDFTAFTPTETYHQRFDRRILDAAWSEEPGSERVVRFEIEADAFMRSMVRALVGTMLEVGAGRRSREDFVSLLAGAPRRAAGETAPAHGLYLLRISY
jgi:tRNA pseudouridine38-40 synthase